MSSEILCKYFQRGICRFGNHCRFAHTLNLVDNNSHNSSSSNINEFVTGELEDKNQNTENNSVKRNLNINDPNSWVMAPVFTPRARTRLQHRLLQENEAKSSPDSDPVVEIIDDDSDDEIDDQSDSSQSRRAMAKTTNQKAKNMSVQLKAKGRSKVKNLNRLTESISREPLLVTSLVNLNRPGNGFFGSTRRSPPPMHLCHGAIDQNAYRTYRPARRMPVLRPYTLHCKYSKSCQPETISSNAGAPTSPPSMTLKTSSSRAKASTTPSSKANASTSSSRAKASATSSSRAKASTSSSRVKALTTSSSIAVASTSSGSLAMPLKTSSSIAMASTSQVQPKKEVSLKKIIKWANSEDPKPGDPIVISDSESDADTSEEEFDFEGLDMALGIRHEDAPPPTVSESRKRKQVIRTSTGTQTTSNIAIRDMIRAFSSSLNETPPFNSTMSQISHLFSIAPDDAPARGNVAAEASLHVNRANEASTSRPLTVNQGVSNNQLPFHECPADESRSSSSKSSELFRSSSLNKQSTYAEVAAAISRGSTEQVVGPNGNGQQRFGRGYSGPGALRAREKIQELCPYESLCSYGERCLYLHKELCEYCQRYVLHPNNTEQRRKHVAECIEEHERNMEHSFAVQRSKDKTCGICFDVVVDKRGYEKQFGILPNCNHVYCLTCIRKWRATNFENKIKKSCPECRVQSDFVCPSSIWVDTKEDKEKLFTEYKNAISKKDCKYFLQGKGKCPFGNKCFYKHATKDGRLVDVGEPERNRTRRNRDNNTVFEIFDHVFPPLVFWDYIDSRNDADFSISDIEDVLDEDEVYRNFEVNNDDSDSELVL